MLPTVGTGSPVHGILANVLIDDELPPEVRLIFRKLQKKDATTKIKVFKQSCVFNSIFLSLRCVLIFIELTKF